MKQVTLLLSAMALLLTANFAQAEKIEAPIWNCSIAFSVKGGGVKVLIGAFTLRGPGEITCVDVAGNVEEIPVLVTMGGRPVSLTFGIGKMKLAGLAAGIGFAGQPSDLLGEYVVGSVRGAFFVGAGADVALHGAHNALTLNASIQGVAGFGANVGFDNLTVEAR